MTDRTRTPVALPGIVAALFALAVTASSALAQQTQAPVAAPNTAPRHIDVSAGVGAHIGIKNDAPLDDDVYAELGLAAPISDHFDAEFQAGFLSGGRNVGGGTQSDNKNAWLLGIGFRWYPLSKPDSPARFFISADTELMIDYHHGDDFALGMAFGPGVRLRAGKQSGFLLRAPVAFDVEHDSPDIPGKNSGREAIIIPSLSYFFQF